MRLGELVSALDGVGELPGPWRQREVTDLVQDSRKASPGAVFVAVRGFRSDGHQFIPQAVRQGAAAVVAEEHARVEAFSDTPIIRVPESRRALAQLAVRLRRPDVLAAEQLLVASNANVGAAKALFFPTISLTGLLGTLSMDFSDMLKADSNVWQVSPSLFAPLFQGGRIRRNYEASKARYDQALAVYQKAALNGYREVADALASVKKLGEARLELEDGVEALRDAGKLARARYDTGLSNYLEILIADQYLFEQELALARVRGDEMRSFVDLYRALGGGWQQEPAAPATP